MGKQRYAVAGVAAVSVDVGAEIVVVLKETIRVMGEIDDCIPSWPIE